MLVVLVAVAAEDECAAAEALTVGPLGSKFHPISFFSINTFFISSVPSGLVIRSIASSHSTFDCREVSWMISYLITWAALPSCITCSWTG
uniref:Putative secreted peptide n=1 Tax=Anopheles braziliensis TaxID=58242 RepID=A0A2M3ZP37_9DIPT